MHAVPGTQRCILLLKLPEAYHKFCSAKKSYIHIESQTDCSSLSDRAERHQNRKKLVLNQAKIL